MRKLLVTAMAGGLFAGGAWLLPTQAANDCPATNPSNEDPSVQTPIGGVCAAGDETTQTGHIWADGDSGNPGPLAGYISAGNDDPNANGVCADDNGGPAAGGATPTCAP